VKVQFSTGLPKLDQYLGGIEAGDSFLAFSSKTAFTQPILESSISAGMRSGIPVFYLPAGNSYDYLLNDYKKVRYLRHSGTSKQPATIIKTLKQLTASHAKNGILLLDDLSIFLNLLKNEKNVTEFFIALTEIALKNKCFLLSTVERNSFKKEHLINLKDHASICVDLVLHAEKLYCVPLSLKGKYTPGNILPQRIDIQSGDQPVVTGGVQDQSGESGMPTKEIKRFESLQTSFNLTENRMFQSASQPMVIFSIGSDFRELNKAACSMLGYSSEEFRLLNPLSLVVPGERYVARRFLADLWHQKSAEISIQVMKKNGKRFPIKLRTSDIGGGYYLGILDDQTADQRNAYLLQRSESEYRAIAEMMPLPTVIVMDGKMVFANQASHILFGFPENIEDNFHPVSKLFVPETSRHFKKSVSTIGEVSAPVIFNGECVRIDGTQFPAQISSVAISFLGKNAVQISFYDLSAQNEFIAKLAESETRYKELIEHATEPVAILDQRRFVYGNRAFTETFGFDLPENIINQDIVTIIHQGDHERFEELFKRLTSKGAKQHVADFRCTLGEGKIGTCSFTFVPVAANGMMRILTFMRDTTDLQNLTIKLSQRDEDLKLLDSIMPVLSSSLDVNKLIHATLQKIIETLSWNVVALYLPEGSSKELNLKYQKNLPDLISQKLPVLPVDEGMGGFIAKTLAPQEISVDHYPSYLPYRTIFKQSGLKKFCLVPLVTNERLVGIIFLGTNNESTQARFSLEMLSIIGKNLGNAITNAQLFRHISESEAIKQKLIESSPDILYTTSPNGKFQSVGPAIQLMTGYTQTEFYKTNSLWLKLIHPEDKKIILERTANLEQQQNSIVSEYRILPKGKAAYRWVRDSVNVIRDAAGNTISLLGTIQDITDDKILIENLRAENILTSELLSSLHEGIIVFDQALTCIRCNASLVKLFSVAESMLVGSSATEIFAPFNNHQIDASLRKVLDGESVSIDDLHVPGTAAIDHGYLLGKFEPLRNRDGEIKGIVAIFSDITQRRIFENEIREAEQILSNVVDAMGDILILTDLKGRVIQVNRAFLHVLGYSRQESNNCEFPYPWILEEEMGRYVLWISNLREHNWLHDFDMTLRAKDGRMIAISLSTTLLRNHLGEPIAMLNLARDITERRRLMRDLENRNKQIEMINRIITKANQTMDFHEIFDTAAEEIKNIVECDTMQVELFTNDGKATTTYATLSGQASYEGEIHPIESTIAQFVLKGQLPVIVSDFTVEEKYKKFAPVSGTIRSQITLPISLKGRVFGTLNLGGYEPYLFNDDHSAILLPVAQQIGVIIERILLFKQVSEDSAYIHNLLDSIDSVVYTVDTQMRIREVNKAWFDFLEEYGIVKTHDYHGMNLFDAIPSEPLKIMFQNIVEPLLMGSIRIFSQEFVHSTPRGDRTFQLTINPMVINHKVMGLVFTHTDISALKFTEAHLKKSNEQLMALNEISTFISSSLDFKKMLVSAIPLVKKVTGAAAIAVYLQEPGSGDLTLSHSTGIDSYNISGINRVQHHSSLMGSVLKLKKPVYLDEKAYLDNRITDAYRATFERLHVEAIAFIPLIANDQVFGVIDLFYLEPHKFSNQEQQLLTLVGNQLGSAVENTRLYSELRSQLDQLTVLYGLSQQLTSTLSIDQIFQSVYEHIKIIIPFKSFRINLYDGVMKIFTPVFHVEIHDGTEVFISDPSHPLVIGKGSPMDIAAQTNRSYRTDDNRTIFIPMLSKESLIGLLTLTASENDEYTDTQVQILESISNLSAIALEKGTLYEETLQKSVEIQQRNKELDDFTYVVSHDLKEPLISVEGFSRILQLDYSDIIQEEGREYLESIVGATTRMKGLIDDLLLLSRVSRPSESFKVIDVGEILTEIKTDMEYTIRQKNVQFIVPEFIPRVLGNETQLKIVFRNLISNAVKFNNRPNPMVQVGFQNAENNYYLFSVTDNGIGIAKEFHEKIFIIFQRLHRREEYEGSGAGLAIVKKIIELHKGKIWIESEVGTGSTFFFTLPRPILIEPKDL
jgi:PAS domain S-box-containing protein